MPSHKPNTTQTIEIIVSPDGHEKKVITERRVTKSLRSTRSPKSKCMNDYSEDGRKSPQPMTSSETDDTVIKTGTKKRINNGDGSPPSERNKTKTTTTKTVTRVINRRRYVNGKLVLKTREVEGDSDDGKKSDSSNERTNIKVINQNRPPRHSVEEYVSNRSICNDPDDYSQRATSNSAFNSIYSMLEVLAKGTASLSKFSTACPLCHKLPRNHSTSPSDELVKMGNIANELERTDSLSTSIDFHSSTVSTPELCPSYNVSKSQSLTSSQNYVGSNKIDDAVTRTLSGISILKDSEGPLIFTSSSNKYTAELTRFLSGISDSAGNPEFLLDSTFVNDSTFPCVTGLDRIIDRTIDLLPYSIHHDIDDDRSSTRTIGLEVLHEELSKNNEEEITPINKSMSISSQNTIDFLESPPSPELIQSSSYGAKKSPLPTVDLAALNNGTTLGYSDAVSRCPSQGSSAILFNSPVSACSIPPSIPSILSCISKAGDSYTDLLLFHDATLINPADLSPSINDYMFKSQSPSDSPSSPTRSFESDMLIVSKPMEPSTSATALSRADGIVPSSPLCSSRSIDSDGSMCGSSSTDGMEQLISASTPPKKPPSTSPADTVVGSDSGKGIESIPGVKVPDEKQISETRRRSIVTSDSDSEESSDDARGSARIIDYYSARVSDRQKVSGSIKEPEPIKLPDNSEAVPLRKNNVSTPVADNSNRVANIAKQQRVVSVLPAARSKLTNVGGSSPKCEALAKPAIYAPQPVSRHSFGRKPAPSQQQTPMTTNLSSVTAPAPRSRLAQALASPASAKTSRSRSTTRDIPKTTDLSISRPRRPNQYCSHPSPRNVSDAVGKPGDTSSSDGLGHNRDRRRNYFENVAKLKNTGCIESLDLVYPTAWAKTPPPDEVRGSKSLRRTFTDQSLSDSSTSRNPNTPSPSRDSTVKHCGPSLRPVDKHYAKEQLPPVKSTRTSVATSRIDDSASGLSKTPFGRRPATQVIVSSSPARTTTLQARSSSRPTAPNPSPLVWKQPPSGTPGTRRDDPVTVTRAAIDSSDDCAMRARMRPRMSVASHQISHAGGSPKTDDRPHTTRLDVAANKLRPKPSGGHGSPTSVKISADKRNVGKESQMKSTEKIESNNVGPSVKDLKSLYHSVLKAKLQKTKEKALNVLGNQEDLFDVVYSILKTVGDGNENSDLDVNEELTSLGLLEEQIKVVSEYVHIEADLSKHEQSGNKRMLVPVNTRTGRTYS